MRGQPTVLVDRPDTAPRGESASATTPISSPFGPLKRISSPSAVAGAPPAEEADVVEDSVSATLDGVAPALVAAALVAELASPSSPQAAEQGGRPGGCHPQQAEAPQRLPSGQQPGLAVEGDLLHDVVL